MKCYKPLFRVIILIGIFLLVSETNFGEKKSSYKMEFIRAVQFNTDVHNHILAIFKVTPTIKRFKFILSMKVTYGIGQGEIIVDVQKQKEDNIRIGVYGNDVKEKNQMVYDLIKDKIQLDNNEDFYLITFDFYDITREKIDNMSIIYGLWESNNTNIRNEQRYDFKVEKID